MTSDDFDHLRGVVEVRAVEGRNIGYEISGGALKVLQIAAAAACIQSPQTTKSGSPTKRTTAPPITLLVPQSVTSWAEENLGALHSEWENVMWSRVPKYIHRRWCATVAATAEDKESSPKVEIPTPNSPNNTKHYVTRVALLLWPELCSNNTGFKLTPVLCASLDEFLACEFPVVQRVSPGGAVSPAVVKSANEKKSAKEDLLAAAVDRQQKEAVLEQLLGRTKR